MVTPGLGLQLSAAVPPRAPEIDTAFLHLCGPVPGREDGSDDRGRSQRETSRSSAIVNPDVDETARKTDPRRHVDIPLGIT